MGVPFEALLPYGIMLVMFTVSGAGISKVRHMQNGGKRARHSVDQWDRYAPILTSNNLERKLMVAVMDRDRRLTGFLRGQTDIVEAPAGFEINHPWRVEKKIM